MKNRFQNVPFKCNVHRYTKAYQRTIKSLLHRLKENEETRRVSERDRSEKDDEIEGTVDELSALQREIAERTGELDYLLMEREERRVELDVFRRTQDETSNFLVKCLNEVKDQIITVVAEGGGGGGGGGGRGGDSDDDDGEGRRASGRRGAGDDDNVRVVRGRLEELSLVGLYKLNAVEP